MKTFGNIRDFFYSENKVTVNGITLTINQALPKKSSLIDVDIYAVRFNRGGAMIEESVVGPIVVESVAYQYALTAWNVAKDLQDNPQYTDEELYEIKVSNWKALRKLKIDTLNVSHEGVLYQGDEQSQSRMSRAIVALATDESTIDWTAKDNKVYPLSKSELKKILYAAISQQTRIWNENRPERS